MSLAVDEMGWSLDVRALTTSSCVGFPSKTKVVSAGTYCTSPLLSPSAAGGTTDLAAGAVALAVGVVGTDVGVGVGVGARVGVGAGVGIPTFTVVPTGSAVVVAVLVREAWTCWKRELSVWRAC